MRHIPHTSCMYTLTPQNLHTACCIAPPPLLLCCCCFFTPASRPQARPTPPSGAGCCCGCQLAEGAQRPAPSCMSCCVLCYVAQDDVLVLLLLNSLPQKPVRPLPGLSSAPSQMRAVAAAATGQAEGSQTVGNSKTVSSLDSSRPSDGTAASCVRFCCNRVAAGGSSPQQQQRC